MIINVSEIDLIEWGIRGFLCIFVERFRVRYE